MRHRVHKVKLGRDYDHKRALLRNLSVSIIEHGEIETTVSKAKALRPFIEKLVTKAKNTKGISTVRYLKSKLNADKSVRKLLEEVAPKYKETNGGYTRITRTRTRDGDKAEMAKIGFVVKKEKEKAVTSKKAKAVKKEKPVIEELVVEEKVETKVEEAKVEEEKTNE